MSRTAFTGIGRTRTTGHDSATSPAAGAFHSSFIHSATLHSFLHLSNTATYGTPPSPAPPHHSYSYLAALSFFSSMISILRSQSLRFFSSSLTSAFSLM